MTFRAWLIRLIRRAERSSSTLRYVERRVRADERAKTLRYVLRELERANVDLADMFGRRRRR
jgi:hypothetical protein